MEGLEGYGISRRILTIRDTEMYAYRCKHTQQLRSKTENWTDTGTRFVRIIQLSYDNINVGRGIHSCMID